MADPQELEKAVKKALELISTRTDRSQDNLCELGRISALRDLPVVRAALAPTMTTDREVGGVIFGAIEAVIERRVQDNPDLPRRLYGLLRHHVIDCKSCHATSHMMDISESTFYRVKRTAPSVLASLLTRSSLDVPPKKCERNTEGTRIGVG